MTQNGWEGSMKITVDILMELDLCKRHFHKLNGRPIFLEQAVISVLSPFPSQYLVENLDPEDLYKERDIFCSGKEF